MDEVVDLLKDILDELKAISSKIDDIQGSGLYNTISDVCDKIDEAANDVKGTGLYNSIEDVCDKLGDVTSGLSDVENAIIFNK